MLFIDQAMPPARSATLRLLLGTMPMILISTTTEVNVSFFVFKSLLDRFNPSR